MQTEVIRELPKGLLSWYPWQAGDRVLYIGKETDSIVELLQDRKIEVISVEAEESFQESLCQLSPSFFNYIIAIHVLEKNSEPKKLLAQWRHLIGERGKLFLGVENRFGLRYFCGDRDPYTGRNYDGIENYRRAEMIQNGVWKGRNYARFEIENMLLESGWKRRKFYSVLPDLDCPQMIFAEDYDPKEEMNTRYFPSYHFPDTVFLEEEMLCNDLAKNSMFHQMANTYLIECSVDGKWSGMRQVTASVDRGREYSFTTVVWDNNTVEKCAVYPEGQKHLIQLDKNMRDIKAHGISVVDGELKGKSYCMPYIEGQVALSYLRELMCTNKELFYRELDRFRDTIVKSSEIEEDKEYELVFQKGYIDLVPLNCFYVKGDYVFYDQEFCVEKLPVKVVLTRMVDLLYMGEARLDKILPNRELLERYDLWERRGEWRRISGEFLAKLRKEKELKVFYEQHRKNGEVIHSNRQRINYSVREYQKLFIHIFDNIENRKLILFGSGNFAKKFIELYGKDYPVAFIVDNNKEKWNTKLHEISIASPEILEEMKPEEYKVLICMKNYLSVLQQLREKGARYIGIYDTNMDYPRKEIGGITKIENEKETKGKKYHIGYIAGVFDLFHVGHLNMFKRAKEQCDLLIVGVVTDEGVRKNKKTETFVPFEERIEMIRSCRYVDKAVEIPLNYAGTRDAYRMYQFDCQFSGSDYVENVDWLSDKEFLERNGAEMVFFPYTQSTSSTKIKGLIEKKLL